MWKRFIKFWPAILAIVLFFSLIFGADVAREGARMGLSLAFNMAIPALFPFFVASSLLNDLGVTASLGRVCAKIMRRVYGLPGVAAGPLILGFGGGYPVGVQATVDLHRSGALNQEQAERLLAFCNNTGPAFIVGVCGVGVFGSIKIGLILYGIHVVSALLVGIGTSSCKPDHTVDRILPTHNAPHFFETLVSACEHAAQTCIKVAAFITLFAVFAALLESSGLLYLCADLLVPVCVLFGMPPDAAWPLVCGGLELTRGLAVLPEAMLNLRHAMPVASMLLAFGGLSVWCQSASLAANSGLSLSRCVFGKMLHAVVAGTLTILWCTFAPSPVPVFAASSNLLPVFPLPLRILPVIFTLFALTSRKRRRYRI